jgi:hypothetical protein
MLVGQLMAWMVGRERRAQDRYPERVENVRVKLATTYMPATEEYIAKTFSRGRSAGSMLDDRQYAHFPAVQRGGWLFPIVSVQFDFAHDPAQCAVRLALFLLTQLEDPNAIHHALGLRFEMAEGPDSVHCYPHAQFITAWSIGTRDWMKLPTPEWLPTNFPALPLDVSTPLGLVVAMFVSLYGGEFWRALAGAEFAGQLRQYLEGDRFLSKLA